jgi:hypothetical protein
VTLLNPREIAGLTGSPIEETDLIDEKNLLFSEDRLQFPEAGPIIFAGRKTSESNSPLSIIDLILVYFYHFVEQICNFLFRIQSSPILKRLFHFLFILV